MPCTSLSAVPGEARRRATLLLTLAWLLAGPLPPPAAKATTFNTDAVKRHAAWQSLTLSLGEERLYRAAEGDSYGDSLFSVNYTPGACDAPWLELRVDLGERQPESRTVNRVPADLRVDHETIHSGRGEFRVERGDSGFYVHFDLDDRPLLLDEMRRGETLRLRLMRGPDDPWFMVFALAGADAAMDRAQRACRAAVR